MTLTALRVANQNRQAEWCAGTDETPDLAFRGTELAGEAGEACNVIKKLIREEKGWRGSRATLGHLAEELADVVICADLTAMTAGIDLEAAVVAKFNATSEKVSLPTRLTPRHARIDAAARHLRETTQAGKNLLPWDETPTAAKKKWLTLAEGVIAAAEAA